MMPCAPEPTSGAVSCVSLVWLEEMYPDLSVSCAERARAALAEQGVQRARQSGRVRELEAALQEASALFKAEIALKAAELEALHAELG